MLLAQRRAYDLILQLLLPVEANGAGDMSLLVGSCVYVYLDEPDLWIMQVGLHPVCIYQYFWMSVSFVFRHSYSFCKYLIKLSDLLNKTLLYRRTMNVYKFIPRCRNS